MHPKLHICGGELGQRDERKEAEKETNVDAHVVVHAENDLGRAVEARLDVGVDCGEKRVRNGRKGPKEGDVPFSFSKQLLPKSITLMPLLAG